MAEANFPDGLEINSTTGALLLPRMTSAQRNKLTPVPGMMIYNTDVAVQTVQIYIGSGGNKWKSL